MSKVSEYKKKKRSVKSMRIEKADNGGFITHTEFDKPSRDMEDDRGLGSSIYEEPLKEVHPHINAVSKHVKEKFGNA